MAKGLQWRRDYNGEGITMAKGLQWRRDYNGNTCMTVAIQSCRATHLCYQHIDYIHTYLLLYVKCGVIMNKKTFFTGCFCYSILTTQLNHCIVCVIYFTCYSNTADAQYTYYSREGASFRVASTSLTNSVFSLAPVLLNIDPECGQHVMHCITSTLRPRPPPITKPRYL